MYTAVLVVENSPSLRWLYIQQFAKLGVRADAAANGQEAIERVERNWYRLIVIDNETPVMSGIEAIAKIRSLESLGKCKRAFIAAIVEGGEAHPLTPVGADCSLSKPISMDDMRKLLEAAHIQMGASLQMSEGPDEVQTA